MKFRLLYEGDLPPTANKSRPSHVHAVRRALHPQLRRLWNTQSNLKQLAWKSWINPSVGDSNCLNTLTDGERFRGGIESIGKHWSKAGFDLVPLVTSEMELRCSVDITLLRPEVKRLIFQSGDIDGQLKTLFDALRLPKNIQETGNAGPNEDEKPLFVLLEDDRLISEVRVTTDMLLLLPNTQEARPNDAHVVIHIKLNHRSPRTFGNYFG